MILLLGPGATGVVWSQLPDGEQVFTQSCASCHTGAADSRAPSLDALKARTPQAVIESLMSGAMRPQGSRMSGPERRAVAEFVTGKKVGGDVTGADTGRCTTSARTGGASRRGVGRLESDDHQHAISIARARRTVSSRRSATDTQMVAGFPRRLRGLGVAHRGRWTRLHRQSERHGVFARRQDRVHSLDVQRHGRRAHRDCRRPCVGATGVLVYFGDTAANAYALNAETGRVVWTRKVDDHPLARITGSPTLHAGRLYVPVSSYEESQGADPRYECCTFRGSVSALDAATGRVIWKTLMITDPLQRRGTSTAGVALWGPSGSGIWSAPTIDEGRQRLYVATGNAYSAPAHKSSDAVVALDLDTGAIRWMRQLTPGDVYLSNCRAGNPNCPDTNGPDFDFGSPPVLARADGRDVLVIGQKSGIAFALDPARDGDVLWEYRAGQGGVLGGIEWGAAVDGEHAYFAVSDILQPKPGGIHAVRLATGQRAWFTPPPTAVCGTGRGCNAAQSAAVTAIPGYRLFGFERWRPAGVRDENRRGGVAVRHQQGLQNRQRRGREGRVAHRPRSGRRRWYGLRELGIWRVWRAPW